MERKIALVTGASGTIGRAIAVRLATDGFGVVVCGRRRDALEQVAAELPGGPHLALAFDVTSVDAIISAIDSVSESFGAVGILVNNAGGWVRSELTPFEEKSFVQLRDEIEDNLLSTVYMTRAAIPGMLAAGFGRIVNVSSIAGIVGLWGHGAYSAAKAGQDGFARQLAMEFGGRGITVNCVAPGPVLTPMVELLEAQADPGLRSMLDSTPTGRVSRPQEIAAAVGFLCSPGAAQVNGHVLVVDGGMTVS